MAKLKLSDEKTIEFANFLLKDFIQNIKDPTALQKELMDDFCLRFIIEPVAMRNYGIVRNYYEKLEKNNDRITFTAMEVGEKYGMSERAIQLIVKKCAKHYSLVAVEELLKNTEKTKTDKWISEFLNVYNIDSEEAEQFLNCLVASKLLNPERLRNLLITERYFYYRSECDGKSKLALVEVEKEFPSLTVGQCQNIIFNGGTGGKFKSVNNSKLTGSLTSKTEVSLT